MEELLSVGIDIGTTTTQVIFSRLQAQDTASWFTVPKVEITGREVLYKSPIHFTPLLDESLIDGDAVRALVAEEFRKAGYSPRDTSTGAVIITGESARKENARIVLEKLSGFAGEFVVSTAGPDLESVVAGQGAGAQEYSLTHRCTVANLDIGGGTTNIAVFSHGDTVATGCYDIGGRLIRVEEGLIRSISPPAAAVAESLGLRVTTGEPADSNLISRITHRMAELLGESLGLLPSTALEERLRTGGSTRLHIPGRLDAVSLSGGVADCINLHTDDPFPYGDIGLLLGRSIAESPWYRAVPVIGSQETIRATVIGAGTCTTTVSGSTITCQSGLFPLKNLPCLRLSPEQQEQLFRGNGAFLPEAIRWFREQSDSEDFVLAMEGKNSPSYRELKQAGGAVAAAFEAGTPPGTPIFISVERDIGKALGGTVRGALTQPRDVVCIDGVRVLQGDYLDMGRPLAGGLAIPVVVKTLLFG